MVQCITPWVALTARQSNTSVSAQTPVNMQMDAVRAQIDVVDAKIDTASQLQILGTTMVSAGPVALLGLVGGQWMPGFAVACTATAGAIIVTGGMLSLIQVKRRK